MFFPEGQVRVFLYGQPVNMRLSYDGLYALARHSMQQDPLSGNLFAFINRRQRIFQQPFSWKSLGVDVRGRSRTLHINYRTSHQIRARADQLLGPDVSDVDGNTEDRRGTVSVFNGPTPEIRSFNSEAEECTAIATWLLERVKDGLAPHELGVFVRSEAQWLFRPT